MGPLGCPETSVRDKHYTLPNIPEERNSRGYSLLVLLTKHYSSDYMKEDEIGGACVTVGGGRNKAISATRVIHSVEYSEYVIVVKWGK